jgi:TolB-like protein/Tfp pilus assembly protein PilF
LRNIEEGLPLGTKIQPRRATFTQTLIRKKLLIPTLVVALAIIALLIWQLLPQKGKAPVPAYTHSIAVLPFDDLSQQKDQEYFCDGLTEELINRLTNIASLRVPARTSSFFFKGKEVDIQEIGKRLNVAWILEGSIRKAEDTLRITVQLIDVKDGYHIWSERYDRKLDDIFAIQDEISLAVVDKLKINLIGGEKEKALLTKRYTESHEAYELYLKGRYFLEKFEIQKSLDHFHQAIEKDPTFVLPYAGIGLNYNTQGLMGFLSPKEAFPRAKEAAEKALEMDDTLGYAHAVLGTTILLYDWDWEASERENKRAIELNPNNAGSHFGYAFYLSAMGRLDEALAEHKRAIELDPLSLSIRSSLGLNFRLMRQNDRAIEQFKKVLEMNPNDFIASQFLALTYADKGMYDEAMAKAKKLLEFWGPNNETLPTLGIIYSKSGKKDKAKEILNELLRLEKQSYVQLSYYASIYGYLGEMDQAFEWLEKAYEERDQAMSWLKVWPNFNPLRSDHRFKAMLKKMNLE